MLDALDAVTICRCCAAGLDAFHQHQRELDKRRVGDVVATEPVGVRPTGCSASGGEVVIMCLDALAPPSLRRAPPAQLSTWRPFVEIRTCDGGQPDQLVLVGVE